MSKPHVRPIVRRKEIKKVEFGAKENSIQTSFVKRGHPYGVRTRR